MPFFKILLLQMLAFSHPVSFEDSFMIESHNSHDHSEFLVIYSDKYWLGYGLTAQRYKNDWIYSPQISLLAKRWNLADAQANIYLYAGYGLIDYEEVSRDTDGIARFGFQADYETRKVFTALKVKRFDTFKNTDISSYTIQAGFAPYVASYNELNTWLIGDWSYLDGYYHQSPEASLLLRFFYKNIYWELGASAHGNMVFNFMIHYLP